MDMTNRDKKIALWLLADDVKKLADDVKKDAGSLTASTIRLMGDLFSEEAAAACECQDPECIFKNRPGLRDILRRSIMDLQAAVRAFEKALQILGPEPAAADVGAAAAPEASAGAEARA